MERASAWSLLRSWWARIASLICQPIVYTGFSDVMGSWKIMAMPVPRTPFSCFSLRPSTSRPWNLMEPRI